MHSFKFKFALFAGVLLAFILMVNAGVSSWIVHQRATDASTKRVATSAQNAADAASGVFYSAVSIADGLATVLSAKVDEETSLEFEREHAIQILRKSLLANDGIVAVYTVWNEEAFDGLDTLMGGEPGHDDTGRFKPSWVAGVDGAGPELAPLADDRVALLDGIDGSAIAHVPSLCDASVMVFSVSVPIRANDRIYGSVGVDISVPAMNDALFRVKGDSATHWIGLFESSDEAVAMSHEVSTARMVQRTAPTAFDGWSIRYGVPADEVMNEVRPLVAMQLVIGLLCMLGGTPILFFLGQRIAAPIKAVAERIEEINTGDGDLTKCVEVNSKDEIGRVAESFNTLVAKIREIVTASLHVGDEVVVTAGDVSRLAGDTVKQLALQADRTAQVAAAAQELSSSTDAVAEHCGRARDLSAETSERASDGGETVRGTAEAMAEMAGFVNQSAEDIEDLGRRSEEIGDIVTVINDIADQTNLLALNAAIEAARAGEHGRGFAVVADEVRKLADRTAKATAEIAESIAVVRSTTDRAVERMRGGLSRVETGVGLAQEAQSGLSLVVDRVRSVDEMIGQIDHSAREQTDAANGIAENIADIDSISRSTSESSRSVAEKIDQLSERAKDLRGHLSRFKVD